MSKALSYEQEAVLTLTYVCGQARSNKRKAVSSDGGLSDSDYETGRRTAGRNNKNKPSYVVPDTDEVRPSTQPAVARD